MSATLDISVSDRPPSRSSEGNGASLEIIITDSPPPPSPWRLRRSDIRKVTALLEFVRQPDAPPPPPVDNAAELATFEREANADLAARPAIKKLAMISERLKSQAAVNVAAKLETVAAEQAFADAIHNQPENHSNTGADIECCRSNLVEQQRLLGLIQAAHDEAQAAALRVVEMASNDVRAKQLNALRAAATNERETFFATVAAGLERLASIEYARETARQLSLSLQAAVSAATANLPKPKHE